MITIYFWDAQGIYTHSADYSPMDSIPPQGTLKAPPVLSGNEVAQWSGTGWIVLPERPAPPEPVPDEIEGWQGEVVMRAMTVDPDDPGSLSVWDRVQDLIAAMPDGIEKITAQTVLRRGRIRRDSPTLAQLAPLVPLSPERVDEMFRLGGGIEA